MSAASTALVLAVQCLFVLGSSRCSLVDRWIFEERAPLQQIPRVPAVAMEVAVPKSSIRVVLLADPGAAPASSSGQGAEPVLVWARVWQGFVILGFAVGVALLAWGVYRAVRCHAAAKGTRDRPLNHSLSAHEPYDRLLQGLTGLLLLVQAARDAVPREPGRAAELLDGTLTEGDRILRYGYALVRQETGAGNEVDDLTEAIAAMGHAFTGADKAPTFRVLQEGSSRSLKPVVRNEAYRIVSVAVEHAVRFERPSLIEAELCFSHARFGVRIRGNGQGMKVSRGGERFDEDQIVQNWLRDLHGQARRFGGQLSVWSSERAGTEIEFTCAGPIAYGATPLGAGPWLRQVITKGWQV